MKIVFFGSPAAALPSLARLLQAGHHVELVITQPDRPAGRGKAITACAVKTFAGERGLPVYQPEKIKKDPRALEMLSDIQPDINVVVAFGQILPASVIYLPRHHSVNVHFSLLPKYRGASPVAWALLEGEHRTGVTVFELDEKMDEGGVLMQQAVEIHAAENAGELEQRLALIGADVLVRTLEQRDRLSPVPQDHSQATYARKLSKDDGRISWSEPAAMVERRVRAFTPWPTAFTHFQGVRLQVSKGRAVPDTSCPEKTGSIVAVDKEGIRVCCGQATMFLIERLKPAGRADMPAHAFAQGTHIDLGALME